MSWKIDTLGNYSKVISGYAFKSDSFRTDNGIPIIKIKNIQREYVEIDGEYFVDTSYLSLDPKFHCIKNDILISLTGSHITLPNSVVGRVAKYHYDFTSLLNQRGGKIVVTNPYKLENNYLYYYLCQNEIRIKLAQFGRGGANQCNISPSNVESIPIILPPLETQKRIASILSNYDDLIENNHKRIKLLEETAQNIYKEWFVNFRFPNYEHTEFDAESGLPVGWEMKKVEDCIKVMKGKKPKKEYSTIGENRILYLLVDVLERRELRFTENESVQLTSEGETLMLMDGSRSGLVFKSLEGAIGSTLAVFRIKNAVFGINYCFNFFKFREVEIISKNTGSAIPHANKSYIYGMEMPIPSDKISTEFEIITSKIYKQIEILSSQNQKLKEARDILLPRLMNRTIEV
jgi:type I restriction enzyme S subunit